MPFKQRFSYALAATNDTATTISINDGTDVVKSSPMSIDKKGPAAMATMRRLLELASPERHLMLLSVVTMGLSSAVSLSVPTFSGKIIDLSIGEEQQDEQTQQESSSPFRLLMILLSIMTVSSFFSFFRVLWLAQAGHRLVARLRRRLYAAMLSQDAAYFDAVQPGDMISRLSSDADLVQSAVTDKVVGLFRNIVLAVGSMVLSFFTSVSLAMVSVAILPPIALTARLVGRRMKDRYTKVREFHAEATSYAEQALTCIRTVQQFVTEEYESAQYNQAINQAHAESIQSAKLSGLFRSVMGLVVNLALLCVLGYGGVLVSKKVLSPGDLASFVMYSVIMGTNISGISTQYIDLMKAIAAANRVFEIIDREPPIPPPHIGDLPENDLLLPIPTKDDSASDDGRVPRVRLDALEMAEIGDALDVNNYSNTKTITRIGERIVPMSVDFEDVTFSYPTRPESKILCGLNISIKAGQVVALVGGSGAGKSTIASLLTRLYDPQSGAIKIDKTTIREMDPQDVRRRIGIVTQEPLLFPTTIEANIRYGTPSSTTLEQVREAARLAFVLDFADKFPDGLQTMVGPRGTQLSGGQKQRVAVARCILKNPPIVIFDEATSALDAESESQVQKAIDTACQGRTVIMIAHRLSTIRNVDTIAVLIDGQVAETGSFEELIENHGSAFRNLMEKQLLVQ